MDYNQAVKAMRLRLPIIYKFGRNVQEYQKINKIITKIEFGEVKVMAELQDPKRDNVIFIGYIERIEVIGGGQ